MEMIQYATVFFNLHVVSKSSSELSSPICTCLELRSDANLPCLINLALCLLSQKILTAPLRLFINMEEVIQTCSVKLLQAQKMFEDTEEQLKQQCQGNVTIIFLPCLTKQEEREVTLTSHKSKPAQSRFTVLSIISILQKPFNLTCQQVTTLDSMEKPCFGFWFWQKCGSEKSVQDSISREEIGRLISEQMRPVRATHFSNYPSPKYCSSKSSCLGSCCIKPQ